MTENLQRSQDQNMSEKDLIRMIREAENQATDPALHPTERARAGQVAKSYRDYLRTSQIVKEQQSKW